MQKVFPQIAQKLHIALTNSRGEGVFEVSGRCSPRVMTPVFTE